MYPFIKECIQPVYVGCVDLCPAATFVQKRTLIIYLLIELKAFIAHQHECIFKWHKIVNSKSRPAAVIYNELIFFSSFPFFCILYIQFNSRHIIHPGGAIQSRSSICTTEAQSQKKLRIKRHDISLCTDHANLPCL